MAVLVYENDRDAPLPTSRAGLYREFVSLLREGRVSGISSSRSPQGAPAEAQSTEAGLVEWLEERTPDLITVLAVAHVNDPKLGLLPTAIEWIIRHATGNLQVYVENESSWIGILRSVLIATSLVVANGNDIEFIHLSIAEYIAAGSRSFNIVSWRSEIKNEVTRSLALFTLARSGRSIDEIIDDLLDGPDPDLITAGYLRLDGMISDVQQRRRVDDALFSDLSGQERWRALELLTQLASDPDVRARLVNVAGDLAESSWVRVLAAHALADHDPEEGINLLRNTAAHHTFNGTAAALWATERLISMGDDAAYYIAANLGLSAASIDTYPPPALRRMALDTRSARRLQAALQLGTNDDIGLAVLQEFAISPVYRWERLYAAEALAQASDPTAVAVLHELYRESEGAFRFQVALALLICGESTGLDDIKAVAISLNPDLLGKSTATTSRKRSKLHDLNYAVKWYLLGRGYRAAGSRDELAKHAYYAKDPRSACVEAISEMVKLNQPAALAIVRELAELQEVDEDIRASACIALIGEDRLAGIK